MRFNCQGILPLFAPLIGIFLLQGCSLFSNISVWDHKTELPTQETEIQADSYSEESPTEDNSLFHYLHSGDMTTHHFRVGTDQLLSLYQPGIAACFLLGGDEVELVPLLSWQSPSSVSSKNYLTFNEALQEDLIFISKKNTLGEILVFNIENRGFDPIFILAGDRLKDHSQQRVLLHDIYLPPNSDAREAYLRNDLWIPPGYPRPASEVDLNIQFMPTDGVAPESSESLLQWIMNRVCPRLLKSKRVQGISIWRNGELIAVEIFGNNEILKKVASKIIEKHLKGFLTEESVTEQYVHDIISMHTSPRFYSRKNSLEIIQASNQWIKRLKTLPDGFAFEGKSFKGQVIFSPEGDLLHYQCVYHSPNVDPSLIDD